MIQDFTFEKGLYQPPPQRFEAGTGNIVNVSRHEHMLLTYATAALWDLRQGRNPGLV